MKKIVLILSSVCLMVQMNACKTTEKVTAEKPSPIYISDNSKNSLDWAGTYTGVVPCADCKGIQTQIVLNADKTYKLTRQYLEKEAISESFTGTFQWSIDGNVIRLNDLDEKDFPVRFKVGENILTQLDMDGNIITGENAQNYIISKLDQNLVNKHWQLVELFGNPVDAAQPENAKNAFITFFTDESRVSGFSGCNSFSGTYQLKQGSRLSISNVISTMKMCMNAKDTEKKLFEAINQADSYYVNGNTLTLNRARAPLAKFEAVYMK
jgi:heat shock protein HslJ